ncbi:MAG TPA: Hint domain-containing protein [Alphaproteobacteria bacterium]|nr:Hint domain-containing protein [Alphaproteobacteria bacterium]
MTTSQISGDVSYVSLTSAGYTNPVTVTATGTVGGTSANAIFANTAWTIVNYGTIASTIASKGQGVDLSAGGSLTNEAGGVIEGSYNGAYVNKSGTIFNAGVITGTGARAAGVTLYNSSTLINSGAVDGDAGVYDAHGGGITNMAGATIAGQSYGIFGSLGAVTIDNAGAIGASAAGGQDIYLLGGGNITNETGGTISGGGVGILTGFGLLTLDNAGVISNASGNAVVMMNGGTVTNAATGTITGNYSGIGGGGAVLSVGNAGTISSTAPDGNGVYLSADTNTLVNTGLITGAHGAFFTGQDATLDNAGTVIGTGGPNAVAMIASGSNRLIVHAGAVFDGTVEAESSAANTIELASGASAGTLTALGSEYIGFQTVTIDSGATWEVTGKVAAFDFTTIEGFTSDDKLDLTNLTFDAGDHVDLNHTTDMLTIEDGTDHVLATIQLAGDFTGDFFHLSNDGGNYTLLTEDTTPCYCRGTRIQTSRGEVPVEELKIGDLIVTLGGEALPLKWIGRRSYRDWLAVGNDEVQPILFKAGSIADGIPARDLYVSPEHAMFIDGMLIPARHLVNGASIGKMRGVEEIDYFHLEFDRHAVIFAEDAPAESFVDDDSRMLFHNAQEYRRLYPDEPPRRTEFCAPRVGGGSALETVRRRLCDRAGRLRPNGTALPDGVRRGFVDRASRSGVEGWALAADRPAVLAILLNGAVIGQTTAGLYRADLAAAGIGGGHCAFRFDLPPGLSADTAHRIEVRREHDWTLLQGAPVTLKPPSQPSSSLRA